MSSGLTRRGLFALFGRSRRGTTTAAAKTTVDSVAPAPAAAGPASVSAPPDRVAVIQGRFCLAYTSFCSVCAERCPVPGAMKVEKGIPMVVAGACTGCGVCHEVCPAPTNAVLVLPRRHPPRGPLPTTPPPAAS